MRSPKFLRRLRARLGGYFWLPCPLCGEMFGGFECSNQSVFTPTASPENGNIAQVVCRPCSRNRRPEIWRNHVEYYRRIYHRAG